MTWPRNCGAGRTSSGSGTTPSRSIPPSAISNSRSTAVEAPLRALADDGLIGAWRGELYPVTADWHAPPLMRIERAACPRFGIRAFGVHINGFVRKGAGLHMWVARRAYDKPTFPGMLDNMVAGGQPIGFGLLENVIKECGEEAGIPEDIARRATAVGMISYTHQPPEGTKPDQMFCYDLELPEDFHAETGRRRGRGILPLADRKGSRNGARRLRIQIQLQSLS